MDLRTMREGANLIVDVEGRVDGTNATDFQAALERAVQPTDRAVIMDMAGLQFIASAGLRAILMAARSLRQQDAKLLGCSLSEKIREVFEISGFDRIVDIYGSREDALRALDD